MHPRGMVGIALPFATGILVAAHAPLPTLCLAATAAVGGVACVFAPTARRTSAILVVAVFALGGVHYLNEARIPASDVSRFARSIVHVKGAVCSDPEPMDDRLRFVMRVDDGLTRDGRRGMRGRVLVTLYPDRNGRYPALEYGDEVRISGPLYQPLDPSNPGAFPWRGYLARNGIHCCASVRQRSQITKLGDGRPNPLVSLALSARDALSRSILRMYPGTEGSVIAGMVLGTYAYLPDETFRSFQRTGTLHLLAASGYNCYVLLFFSLPILRVLRVPPKPRTCTGIALLLGYALVAGWKPSLVRATLMAGLWLLAVPLRRAPNISNLYFAALLMILVVSPSQLFDIGLQLSFVAVGALIWVLPVVQAVLSRSGVPDVEVSRHHPPLLRAMERRASEVMSAATGTVAISLATAPPVAYYFNYISLVSLPANVLLVTGVPIVFAAGFLAPVMLHIPVLGALTSAIGTWVVHTMLEAVDGLGGLSHASIAIAAPGVGFIAGYYVLLYAALAWTRHRLAQ